VKPPFAVRGLDHVVLRVRELEPALHFYTRALGGVVERRIDALGLVQVRLGASLIDLVPVDSPLGALGGAAPAREGRNLDHFALRIEPGEISLRYGAEGSGPSMYVRDPDGNTVELKGPPTEPR